MSEQTNEKEQNWLLPQRRKNAVVPGLYLVATPIGNLGDITLRALDVLAGCDRVICEDTRVSGKLLEHFGIKKPLLPYNDHNAAKQRGPVLQMLRDGQRVAFISDAGTPLVSDPGYKLVRECIEEGIVVTAIPGANAPLMALQLSGLPSDAFSFIGFLPPKSAARKKHLTEWKNAPGTLIAFETAPRLQDALMDIREALGDREVAVARELTKLHEEILRGRVSALIENFKDVKGEIVLVIGRGETEAMGDDEIIAALKKALRSMSTKEAAAYVAEISGRPRKEIYSLAINLGR
ncbi:MAG TPA: 16S rRNA (cytidine(1402)-2'-O)-methyltransferase [Alphaproteobacteria bacterium]|nr:16S rRNA (cytidine(1402)-2'-O)-methyltransferase [Micavibrio sp.]MBK9562816.1 16S rRNA (cytidine(1402)-2'-O)-methyltransferase [Micavibrio sp.]HQX27465.1 16S rRNA (cytidine(1402)-2'-O)-methyltransferase [Alphaproteobacteria bacterium]